MSKLYSDSVTPLLSVKMIQWLIDTRTKCQSNTVSQGQHSVSRWYSDSVTVLLNVKMTQWLSNIPFQSDIMTMKHQDSEPIWHHAWVTPCLSVLLPHCQYTSTSQREIWQPEESSCRTRLLCGSGRQSPEVAWPLKGRLHEGNMYSEIGPSRLG